MNNQLHSPKQNELLEKALHRVNFIPGVTGERIIRAVGLNVRTGAGTCYPAARALLLDLLPYCQVVGRAEGSAILEAMFYPFDHKFPTPPPERGIGRLSLVQTAPSWRAEELERQKSLKQQRDREFEKSQQRERANEPKIKLRVATGEARPAKARSSRARSDGSIKARITSGLEHFRRIGLPFTLKEFCREIQLARATMNAPKYVPEKALIVALQCELNPAKRRHPRSPRKTQEQVKERLVEAFEHFQAQGKPFSIRQFVNRAGISPNTLNDPSWAAERAAVQKLQTDLGAIKIKSQSPHQSRRSTDQSIQALRTSLALYKTSGRPFYFLDVVRSSGIATGTAYRPHYEEIQAEIKAAADKSWEAN